MTTIAHVTDDVLAALVDRADDAVIVADAAGTIRYWNAAAERMFGYSREQALGSSLDLIIPEKLRDRHWEGYWRVMATGETAYAGRMLAVPALRADGSRISIEFTVTLLHDPSGAAIWGIAAILRDVTARWEQHRALQHEVQDLRRRVAESDG
jgi:PAS domain S-box-containing protein